ncbi:hypothetical protein [Methylobrevis pamukkalensis]|uniref:MxaK protein n=1 Tax=Methylobrevis pamukkalensis TaxID=1439726 RepID=A0A1E3H8H6_9HYPH|nr:hypothetical protein [Methylobrevis pamukkalensis]ODN71801.1 mxaK protein [Methylobrevis pamukkalensis]
MSAPASTLPVRIATAKRRAGGRLAAFARDPLTPLLVLLALAGLAAAAVAGWQVLAGKRTNAVIRDLAAGRDIAVPMDAPAELLLARGDFLVRYDRVDAAEGLIEPMTRAGRPDLLADLWYTIGHGRMLTAFEGVADQDVDAATPQVRIAKEAYRRALALEPQAYDAKVNLDLAMRLVRDFPSSEAEGSEDPEAQPKNLWTDLPGLPRGLP